VNICTSEKEYISQISEPARRVCARYGYLPSVLIAQSCLENGYGIPGYWDNPQIAALMRYNNMVGIKTRLLNESWTDIGLSVWPGKSLEKETPEEYGGKSVTITDSFRKYDSIEQSFADFLCFLTWASNEGPGGVPKYGPAVLGIKDPGALIEAVHSRGYATGKTYARHVKSIISKHNLTKYDDLNGVTPTAYYPVAAGKKKEAETVTKYTIIDITAQNRSQVPASRGSHPIEWIVMHYLGVPNADNPYLYDHGFGGHYNVTRAGKIYKAANPRTAVIWHCGGGIQGEGPGAHKYYGICDNWNSIGIECGVNADTTKKQLPGDSPLWWFTEETQEAAAWLVAQLMREYHIDINHVIRHYDVTGKTCPNPYVLNNKRKTSWTWTEFKTRVLSIYNGTAAPAEEAAADRMLRRGDSGEDVREMQEDLWTAGYCSCSYYQDGGKARFCDGAFGAVTETSVRMLQEATGLDVDGIYGPKSKRALANLIAGRELKTTAAEFLAMAKEIAGENRAAGFSYGDAPAAPAVYPAAKLTSCDRYVGQVLYAAGLHDVGNRSVHDLSDWLLTEKGGKKVTAAELQPGDVIFQSHHTYILGNPAGGGLWERYDSGSVYRIRLTGPYKSYKSQPFKEPLGEVLFGVRLPFKADKSDKSDSEKSDSAKLYRVQAGAFSVKANAERMRDKLAAAGIKAIIRDVGTGDRYIVQVGAYKVRKNAVVKAAELSAAGYDFKITED